MRGNRPLRGRHRAVLREEVAAFANRSDDVDRLQRSAWSGFAQRDHFVMPLVERRADQVVHAGIDDLEGLGGPALSVNNPGDEDSRACRRGNVLVQSKMRNPSERKVGSRLPA